MAHLEVEELGQLPVELDLQRRSIEQGQRFPLIELGQARAQQGERGLAVLGMPAGIGICTQVLQCKRVASLEVPA